MKFCGIFRNAIQCGRKMKKKRLQLLEVINQFGLQYIYTWKWHNETPCIAILNKQTNTSFFKNREQEGKTDPFLVLVPVRGRRI
jgi:hypothetical protein